MERLKWVCLKHLEQVFLVHLNLDNHTWLQQSDVLHLQKLQKYIHELLEVNFWNDGIW